MQSWKSKKLRDEKRKAKRVERQIIAKSRADSLKITGSKEVDKRMSEPIKDFRFLEKLRLSIRRSVFR